MGSKNKILVCVTQQKTCERLINKGAEVRDELDGELFVIHVAGNDEHILGNSSAGDALEYLFGKSKLAGAELTVLRSDDVVKSIVNFSKDNKINKIIMGGSRDDCERNIFEDIKRKLPSVEIIVMPPKDFE